MSAGIVKVGDSVSGICNIHGSTFTGTVNKGSASVTCQGQPVAYLGATAALTCGHTATFITASGMLTCPEGRVAIAGDTLKVNVALSGVLTASASTTSTA